MGMSMAWDTAPPEPRTRMGNWPTLLFSWWCTAFAVVIILTRLAGRMIRTGHLFQEDRVMGLSLLPLLARMALVHVILISGTNNVQTEGLTDHEISLRRRGSKFVLASRICYAAFIWMSKFTVSEFLKRITSNIWRRSYEIVLQCIRIFLLATFIAVVIATLAECQPFDHYWQVVPDPGAACRLGYAQLITMGTADMITDILLVVFPIPIVLRSQIPFKRKLSLVCLFSFSIALIIITAMRMPRVIEHHGRQQYRTVWASAEIVASAAVSNAIILGSFVKDRGVKKKKYRPEGTIDSISRADTRRATIASIRRDSEEALFRQMGCRMPDDLCHSDATLPRPAPIARPPTTPRTPRPSPLQDLFMSAADSSDKDQASPHDSADTLRDSSFTPPSTGQSISFFDIGGLLGNTNHARHDSSGTTAQDFALSTPTFRPQSQGSTLVAERRRSSIYQRAGRPQQEPTSPTTFTHPQLPSSPSTIASDEMGFQHVGGLLR